MSGTNLSHSLISELDIFEYFGTIIADRASAYQRAGKVLTVAVSNDLRTIHGTVENNSNSGRFKALIKLDRAQQRILSCECSCDRGGLCKHSAALLFEALRRENKLTRPGMNKSEVPSEGDEVEDAFFISVEPPQKDHQPNLYAVRSITQTTTPGTEILATLAKSHATNVAAVEKVVYLLDQSADGSTLHIGKICLLAKKPESEQWEIVKHINLLELQKDLTQQRSQDALIASLLTSQTRGAVLTAPIDFPQNPHVARLILQQLLETKRCFWQRFGDSELSFGEEQEARLEWKTDTRGYQTLSAQFPGQVVTLYGGGLWWYLDATNNMIGPAKFPIPVGALFAIMHAPPLSPIDAGIVAQKLIDLGTPIPLPHQFEVEIVKTPPVACLTLTEASPFELSSAAGYRWGQRAAVAQLSFDYGTGDTGKVDFNKQLFVDGRFLIRKRVERFEKACKNQLLTEGLLKDQSSWSRRTLFLFPLGEEDKWYQFVSQVVPRLEQEGWQIKFDSKFPYQVVVPDDDDWDIETTEGKDFWFSVRLDITVEGQKYPLLPIIKEAIKHIRGSDAVAEIAKLNTNGTFYAPFPDGRKVALEFERVVVIIETLVELFNKEYKINKGKVEITLPQAILLLDLLRVRWHAPARVKELVQKFRDFKLRNDLTVSKNFHAVLRPYQEVSLGWFDFLRELGLGGILADDMGLGKTVQTLAHFAIEKASKRKSKPYLVVCPKSVLPNWLAEIERFVPSMKVIALTGTGRASLFGKIPNADIVVTTYPLIVRDYAVLTEQPWQCVVLDEAQIIKNPESQAAQVARALKADYRICLTGTPVQNNLGELWSLFEFLLPGFLSDKKAFARDYRRPIEKEKNELVQRALATRIKPFLLRRMKEVVAAELPEKVVITKLIELDGAQRDLYETVRVAMYEKVKEALETKGLAKSQIIILDALLKLRQVCCDPRLVSLPAARKINTSAKLDALMDMLDELIAEGRNILLFSQFTSMLDLIVPELEERRIRFVQLRGDTRDRQTPVQAFQSGHVPLFLISLKAGGLGLNLTAADTVIHYDPWWNPAVEDQATDRSHRIGQQSKVFVFRLLASNTIEERMLKLQARKREIAGKIYTDDVDCVPDKLTEEDIKSLFAPI